MCECYYWMKTRTIQWILIFISLVKTRFDWGKSEKSPLSKGGYNQGYRVSGL